LPGQGQISTRDFKPKTIIQLKADKETQLPTRAGDLIQIASADDGDKWARGLYRTSDGHVWLTTETDLFEYDGRTFHRYSSSQGLPATMFQMAEDAAGNLWIGGQAGLVRFDRKGLTTFGESDGLMSTRLFSINESQDGSLYITNGNYNLSQLNGERFRTIELIPPTASSLWTSRVAFRDSHGEWWVLTTEKLYRFAASDRFESLNHAKPLATYTNLDGLNSSSVFQMFEDKRGDIWVSTRGLSPNEHGLARLHRAENKFHTFTEKEGFPAGKAPASFTEDQNGNLWFGFYEGGLARYANGRFSVFGENDGLPDRVISDLHIDRKGRMWFSSTLGGLYRLDDTNAEHPKFVNYSTENGLSSNNIRTITEDFYGNIYAGTARGVDRISSDLARVTHYSIANGLAGDFVIAAFRDSRGTLWFGTPSGLSRLVPDERTAEAPGA